MKREYVAVNPEGWPPPRGYQNGVITSGRLLHVGGQIGWNEKGEFKHTDLAGQFGQTLANIITIVRAAGGEPTDIARMTVYVTDLDAYRTTAKAIGAAWRAQLGKHFPAMALVGVAGLVEPRALVEIEAVAVLGDV